MASLLSFPVIISALELGCIYALVALALFLSYSILNIADLSTDGCFTLGCAVGAQVAIMGHPILALFAAMAAGVCSGYIMAFLQTKLGVESILAGIIVNTGLYTVNLAAMGFSSNLSLFKCETVYSLGKGLFGATWYKLGISAVIVVIVCLLLKWFLGTRLGLSIRATGDNEDMVKACGGSCDAMKLMGLAVSNGLVGLAGGMLAQNQGFADINSGVGMMVIGLASVILGEVIFGTKTLLRRLIAAALGAVVYRIIMAQALYLGMESTDMKLVSAVIVAIALSLGLLGGQGSKLTMKFSGKEVRK